MGGDTRGEGAGALEGGAPERESGGCLLSSTVPFYSWSVMRDPVLGFRVWSLGTVPLYRSSVMRDPDWHAGGGP